jgi:hypothetical protein
LINTESIASGEVLPSMLKLHQRLNGRWFVYQKKEGGLGVLHLETHNEFLLLKNFDKFFNKADTPWVHLVLEKHFNNGKFPNHTLRGLLTVKIRQPSHEFTFGVGMSFIPYPLVLTPMV